MAVTLNTKYLAPFVQSHELAAVAPQVEAAHRTLHEKTGLGNEFLGWLNLPTNYDKKEFGKNTSTSTLHNFNNAARSFK